MSKLLSRDDFRASVFARDREMCVVCKKPAADAHHIIERKLWSDGGYYLENGVSLCHEHHLEAEATTLSCEDLRGLAAITKFPLPDHMYVDQRYDKWGNPVLPSGLRLKGELFEDVSVQRALESMLSLFTDRVKYARTYHLPWSPGVTNDDRVLTDLSAFEQSDSGVIVTLKMDGENTTMYNDYIHARSIEYGSHPSRSWVKALHARIAHDIPRGWRICGENLYAKHSIGYDHLVDYFQVFSVWNEKNECIDWDSTVEWATLLGLTTVPIVYAGEWDVDTVRGLYRDTYEGDQCEGYVVRLKGSFHYRDFRRSVAKYVRVDHVQTHGHWMRNTVVSNSLMGTK